MKNIRMQLLLPIITLLSLLSMTVPVSAATFAFFQNVSGVVATQPTKTEIECSPPGCGTPSDSKNTNVNILERVPVSTAPNVDGRFITETNSWIVEDDVCECSLIESEILGFKHYRLIGFGFLPLLFPIINHLDSHGVVDVPISPPTASPMSHS